MENEIWKYWKETYSNQYGNRLYEVSSYGNVKINGELFDFSCQNKWVYYILSHTYIHRIVAELFVPNPDNKPMIDHINRNKHDNRAENLRWVTNKENMNNPLTLEHIKHSCEHQKQILSEQNKKRRHMSNGIDHVFCLPEQFDYYLSLYYHFGRK